MLSRKVNTSMSLWLPLLCRSTSPGLGVVHTSYSRALAPWAARNFRSFSAKKSRRMPEETFERLREAGLGAERTMLRATGGVNTHKGAIFSLGCVLGACGRLWTPEGPCREPEEILAECGRMSAPAAEGFFAALTRENARTAGERLYVETGERGVRGEAAGGFPAVLKIGLPALRAALDQGAGLEEAGTAALLALTAGTADTNLFARGGMEGQRWAVRQAGALLEGGPRPDPEAVRALDRAMIQRNLSPGGCADLLAITYFLYFMQGK